MGLVLLGGLAMFRRRRKS
ncbi:MAG: hypothetical protein GWP14_00660 [Actinobacteria bacterium]|nr:hypothetical protein [Actinomycetota bacterium]